VLSKQEFKILEAKALKGDRKAFEKTIMHFQLGLNDFEGFLDHITKVANTENAENLLSIVGARYKLYELYRDGTKISTLKYFKPDKQKAKHYLQKAAEYIVFHCDETCFSESNFGYYVGTHVYINESKLCSVIKDEISIEKNKQKAQPYLDFYKEYCELQGIPQ
jgi:hypothetical protein